MREMSLGRVLRGVLVVVLAFVALVAAALLWLQSPWGRGYLRGVAERQAESFLNADVRIGALGGSLLFGATVDDLIIERNAEPIVAIDRVTVDYDAFGLAGGQLQFARIAVERPVVHARRVASLIPRRDVPRQGRPPTLSFDEIIVTDGRVVIGSEPEQVDAFRVPDVLQELEARLSLHVGPNRTSIAVDRLSFVGQSPAVTLKQLSGTVTFADGDLVLEQMRVQLAESSFEFGGTIENFRNFGEGRDETKTEPAGRNRAAAGNPAF